MMPNFNVSWAKGGRSKIQLKVELIYRQLDWQTEIWYYSHWIYESSSVDTYFCIRFTTKVELIGVHCLGSICLIPWYLQFNSRHIPKHQLQQMKNPRSKWNEKFFFFAFFLCKFYSNNFNEFNENRNVFSKFLIIIKGRIQFLTKVKCDDVGFGRPPVSHVQVTSVKCHCCWQC